MQVNPLESESRSLLSTSSEEDDEPPAEEDDQPPAKSTPPRVKGKATLGRNPADTGSPDTSPGQAESPEQARGGAGLRRSIRQKTTESEPALTDESSSD